MSRVPLVTTTKHNYGKVWYLPGDTFEAENETDASELLILGFARRPDPGYRASALTAQPVTTNAAPAKTQYRRRDLAARK